MKRHVDKKLDTPMYTYILIYMYIYGKTVHMYVRMSISGASKFVVFSSAVCIPKSRASDLIQGGSEIKAERAEGKLSRTRRLPPSKHSAETSVVLPA